MNKLLLSLIALAFFTIPLLAQPIITNQPASQTVWAGGNVTFAVGVSNAWPFTYQWQLNGTNITNGIITTVAGNGFLGFHGDGGLATNAILSYPSGVTLDAFGDLFIADNNNNRIREVNTNGIITTVAGSGPSAPSNGSYSGDGGPATNATLYFPFGVAPDAYGNLFIADENNHRVREVSTNGIITTVAGNGNGGVSGNGGQATNAQTGCYGVAVDTSGNLFIADGSQTIRMVNTNGIITTVAGGGNAGPPNYGDGGAATNARLNGPRGVATDNSGDLFIADTMNRRIRKVDTNGIITTVAGTVAQGYSGDGGPATNATLYFPFGVAPDAYGNFFIADSGNNRIREVNTNGIITTVAGNGTANYSGDGGVATNASLNSPDGVAVDASGNLFIADTGSVSLDTHNSRIRKVTNTQGPSLALNNVSAANAGNYQVVVTGPDGSVTSSVAVLTLVLPPTDFTAQLGGTGLQIQFAGTTNYPYILQMATNLTPPVVWQSILTNPADVNGNWIWTITNLSAVPAGYYRAAAQ